MEHVFHIPTKPLRVEALVESHDWTYKEGFYFGGESHNFWEIVYVVEGQAVQTEDERVYHMSAGNLVFIRPNAFHRLWNETKESFRVILLSYKLSGEWVRKFESAWFTLTPEQEKRIMKLQQLHEKAVLMRDSADQLQYRIAVERATAEAESFLLRLLGKEELPPVAVQQADVQYAKIILVMKDNCQNPLSMEELAGKCKMSLSNMKRVFRLFSDISLGKYFLSLRIRRAQELLEEGYQANDVAQRLGFEKISYFYTVFKRETGMTPSQYKRTCIAAREE